MRQHLKPTRWWIVGRENVELIESSRREAHRVDVALIECDLAGGDEANAMRPSKPTVTLAQIQQSQLDQENST